MRNLKLVMAALTMLALLAVVRTLPAQEAKGPKIAASETRHDLGKVVEGTQAVHVFEIKNTGTEPLVIDQVQSS